MKKLVIFSMLLLASGAMTSCTADETPIPIQNQNPMADDTGGQQGTPPPPPNPGTGTGG